MPIPLNLNLRRVKVDHVRSAAPVRAGSRYVFPSDVASPATRVRPAESGFSLWSPADAMLPKPIERQLPGLFSVGGTDVPIPMRPLQSRGNRSSSPASEPLVCCICLEDIEHTPLTCHRCSMSAHPNCLCKWFGTRAHLEQDGPSKSGGWRLSLRCIRHHSTHCLTRFLAWYDAGSDPSSHQTGLLPRSSASCPNCRETLDWDALALDYRRKAKSRRAKVLGSFVGKQQLATQPAGSENVPPDSSIQPRSATVESQ